MLFHTALALWNPTDLRLLSNNFAITDSNSNSSLFALPTNHFHKRNAENTHSFYHSFPYSSLLSSWTDSLVLTWLLCFCHLIFSFSSIVHFIIFSLVYFGYKHKQCMRISFHFMLNSYSYTLITLFHTYIFILAPFRIISFFSLFISSFVWGIIFLYLPIAKLLNYLSNFCLLVRRQCILLQTI